MHTKTNNADDLHMYDNKNKFVYRGLVDFLSATLADTRRCTGCEVDAGGELANETLDKSACDEVRLRLRLAVSVDAFVISDTGRVDLFRMRFGLAID
jgi:hypothetical protein